MHLFPGKYPTLKPSSDSRHMYQNNVTLTTGSRDMIDRFGTHASITCFLGAPIFWTQYGATTLMTYSMIGR